MRAKDAAEAMGMVDAGCEYFDAQPDGNVRNGYARTLYVPPAKLAQHVTALQAYAAKKKPSKTERAAAGKLMEQVAYLAFRGVLGLDTIKNFTSAGPQYDLYANGCYPYWHKFARFVRMDADASGVVVECKAEVGAVGDPTIARLSALLDHNLRGQASLGILFCLKGVTGMPGTKSKDRKIGQARLRQVIFHARTRCSIVVFDLDDIVQLVDSGALPVLLSRKVADLSLQPGIAIEKAINLDEEDLPPHLKSL